MDRKRRQFPRILDGYGASRKALPYTEMRVGEEGGGEGEKQRDRFRLGAPMMTSLPSAS